MSDISIEILIDYLASGKKSNHIQLSCDDKTYHFIQKHKGNLKQTEFLLGLVNLGIEAFSRRIKRAEKNAQTDLDSI